MNSTSPAFDVALISTLAWMVGSATLVHLLKWFIDALRLLHLEDLPKKAQKARPAKDPPVSYPVRNSSKKQLSESIAWGATITTTSALSKLPQDQHHNGHAIPELVFLLIVVSLIFYILLLRQNKSFDIEFLASKYNPSTSASDLALLKKGHDKRALIHGSLFWIIPLIGWSIP